MKILVTGGAGYIGSALVEKLINQGHEVNVLDDLSNGYIQNINPKANFIQGSILSNPSLDTAIKNVDVVYHLAAKISVEESESIPEIYDQVNIQGSIKLLEACQEEGVNKFVFASTAAVYGNLDNMPITEKSRVNPENNYGLTKLKIDEFLSRNAKQMGISALSFRFFNVAGAVQNKKGGWLRVKHKDATHLIPRIIQNKPEAKLIIYGNDWPTPDGTPIRDYIHLSDLTECLINVLSFELLPGHDIINLGSGKGFTVKEVIKIAERTLGRRIVYQFADRRKGDSAALVASNEKAKKVIGWKPSKSLSDILFDSYQEYLSNQ
jgi:UDP-glucose 4-epimerase